MTVAIGRLGRREQRSVASAAIATLALAMGLGGCARAPDGDRDASAPRDDDAGDRAADAGAIDAASDAGIDAPPAPACGPGLGQSETCESCLEASCCEEAAACHEADGCPALFACLHACEPGSGSCWIACLDAAPGEAASASSVVDGCVQRACPPECRAM